MLYFPKLNVLILGFYGLRDLTDVGGYVFEAWGACSRGFESGFTGFRGLERTSSACWILMTKQRFYFTMNNVETMHASSILR
jgi:hypothetical protein